MGIKGYQKKFIAFVDILGFKALINNIETKSRTHESDFRKVESILNYLNEESIDSNGQHDLPIYERTENGLLKKELGNPIITYVSDCVIISTDGNFDGFKSLCNKITKFSTDIASDGIFLRGAIVYGDVYHNGKILFGSGYQNAYLLECEKALNPRIIIDESVFNFLKSHIGTFPLNESAIVRDKADDVPYLSLFPFNYFPYYTFDWLNFLLRVKSHILYHLNLHDATVSGYSIQLRMLENYCCWKDTYTFDLDFTGGTDNILNKYIWIKDEFNRTIVKYNGFLLNEEGGKRISAIVKKDTYWGPEEKLGHIR